MSTSDRIPCENRACTRRARRSAAELEYTKAELKEVRDHLQEKTQELTAKKIELMKTKNELGDAEERIEDLEVDVGKGQASLLSANAPGQDYVPLSKYKELEGKLKEVLDRKLKIRNQ